MRPRSTLLLLAALIWSLLSSSNGAAAARTTGSSLRGIRMFPRDAALRSSSSSSRGQRAAASGLLPLRRLLAEDKDCTAVFSGDPKTALETGLSIGLVAAESVPFLGDVVSIFTSISDVIAPPTFVSGKSIYDCISGFVDEAIQQAINADDLKQVNTDIGFIQKSYDNFASKVRLYKEPNPLEQVQIYTAFDNIGQDTDRLAYYLTHNPRSATGVLAVFVTFATTQYLPFYAMKYSDFNLIYGATSNQTANILSELQSSVSKELLEFKAFVNTTLAAAVAARVAGVSEIQTWCNPPSGCCDSAYTYAEFVDHPTGEIWRSQDESGTLSSCNYDGVLKEARRLRSIIRNRAKTASRVNLGLSTASSGAWLAPNSTKRIVRSVAVEKQLSFSNCADCGKTEGPMPAGHSFKTYNISEIVVRSGDWIDYVHVTYTSGSGHKLTQSFGNSAGPAPRTLSGLASNPITKAEWFSAAVDREIITYLQGITFTRADGSTVQFGTTGATKSSTDDFSAWKGAAWLCGMEFHGQGGVRVFGVAPRWCYSQYAAV